MQISPEEFLKLISRRQLLYLWHLRYAGFDVEDQIKELEEQRYSNTSEIDSDMLHQKNIDELQLLLCIQDNTTEQKFTKAIVYRLEYVKVVMHPEKNHALPHFHIEYKKEHSASYAINTLKLLAGEMPSKYEKPILTWASQYQKSLLLTWHKLQAGESITKLEIHADEVKPV